VQKCILDDLELAVNLSGNDSLALEKISTEEKLSLVQQLPLACRLAFNLYAVADSAARQYHSQKIWPLPILKRAVSPNPEK